MLTILIDQDGNASHLAKPESDTIGLGSIGTATSKRASHIEPTSRMLRFAFHAIRKLGARGEQFTRRWPCTWRVNLTLSGGPTYGTYTDRQQAIDEEERWLISNAFGR
jgi:hypothetical protein